MGGGGQGEKVPSSPARSSAVASPYPDRETEVTHG